MHITNDLRDAMVTTPNGGHRFPLFRGDNGSDFWVKLDQQIGRAVDRMTEGDHEWFCNRAAELEAEGLSDDLAMARALDDVYGGPRWRRFRKTIDGRA